MPGKRKRGGEAASSTVTSIAPITNGKPLSAIAAARLKAEAAAKGVATLELVAIVEDDPAPEPSKPLPQSPVLEPEESDPDEEPLPFKQNLKLCNWRNEPHNIVSDKSSELTVKLHKHATIALVGSFRFKVLRGAVNINGANIGALSRDDNKDQVYTAYVPATHPISKIRGLDGANQVQFSNCQEPAPLANISPLFADIWSAQETGEKSRTFSVINESDADALARPLSPETTPEDWLRAIEECASSASISITIGPSSCGKSTFGKRLLNRYLTGQGKSARPAPAVCYLDLDPAKPGYTPPGQMSLTVVKSLNLGPAFTHPASSPSMPRSEGNTTIRSHAIPSNLANYGDYYRACAEDLFLTYKTLRSRDPTLPLIINTPGSLHSTHMDILADLLARFKPHHAVHLGDTQAIDTEQATKLHAVQTIVSQSRGTIHEITAQSPIVTPMRTDAQLRAMHMQSYFHAKTAATWNTRPLTTLVPWEFCFEDTPERAQDFVGFAMYAEPIEPSSLIHALNGSIVQIVESTSSAIQASLARTKRYRIPYFEKSEQTGMLESLDPKTSKVVCTALVRGFDPERRVVQVLVPKSHEGLLYTLAPERTVFVGGCCDAPEWAYVEEGTGVDVPWVEDEGVVDAMGYLNTVRRVRKFQT